MKKYFFREDAINMRTAIEKRVYDTIKNMEIEEVLTDETIFNADYAEEEVFSSISFVLLIVSLEDEFGIEIESEDLLIENLSSFDKIVRLINEILKNNEEKN